MNSRASTPFQSVDMHIAAVHGGIYFFSYCPGYFLSSGEESPFVDILPARSRLLFSL